jgi:hypothetical protein
MKEYPPESVPGGSTASGKTSRNPDEWRQDIEARKEAIAGTIRQIDRRVHRASDWRVQVGEHPFVAMGAAFVVGSLLSGMFRRKPTPQERIIDAIADSVDDVTSHVRDHIVGRFSSGVTRSVMKTVGAALAAKAAAAYMSGKSSDGHAFADQED